MTTSYLPRMWVLAFAPKNATRVEQVTVEQNGLGFVKWCEREGEALMMLCGALPSELL